MLMEPNTGLEPARNWRECAAAEREAVSLLEDRRQSKSFNFTVVRQFGFL